MDNRLYAGDARCAVAAARYRPRDNEASFGNHLQDRTGSLWREAERAGAFTGAPVDLADGFIHFSTAAQVTETAARHFAGQRDLVLVAVDARCARDGAAP